MLAEYGGFYLRLLAAGASVVKGPVEDLEEIYSRVQPSILVQHTAYVKKDLTTQTVTHNTLASGASTHSLQDAQTLTALDGATIPANLATSHSQVLGKNIPVGDILCIGHPATTHIHKYSMETLE